MKKLILALFVLLSIMVACGDDVEKNRVDVQQINYDKSNNYRYIFKEKIDNEEKKKRIYDRKRF